MSKEREELERIHKRLDTAIKPFTLMLSRPTYSPRVLMDCIIELKAAQNELQQFVERVTK